MDGQGFTVERRIRAAMALAAVDFPELARRISRKGMGTRTIRKWADPNDDATPQSHHLRYIAQACGLAPAFFTVDLAAISDAAESEISELRDRLEAVERQLEAANLEQIASELEALRQTAGERL